MKLMKSVLVIILFILCMPLAGQTPSFDELEFEPDSVKSAYKPVSKNYVFIRSKRGTSGVNKTAAGNAILAAEVSEIVLVFSELDGSAMAEREEANRERWENLLKTYPEYFQFSTTYKNLCQCNTRGDSAAFKQAQGFYVYVNGDVPKVDEPKVATTPPPAAKEEAKPAAAAKPIVKQEVAVPDNTSVKTKEVPVKEMPAPARETPVAKETPKQVQKEAPVKEISKPVEQPVAATTSREEPAAAPEPEAVKPAPKKTPAGVAKPRRAKDPKACRPPCYQGGDDDLNSFFKDNITFTKKQKRAAKKATPVVKLQLNFDGTVKKAMVTGDDEEINQLVQAAVNGMNSWNPAVKSGVTVKSEVKITLKYDGDTKALKPLTVDIIPRPAPKCKCMSDSEIFGD